MALDTLEFERSTKDLDQESSRIESQIADVRESHAKVEDDIGDTEAQIKALEYKISVQKQTQKELCSGKDAIDAKGMEKEIALMKKRLRTLVASQERLLREMELAIHKREDIAVKGRSSRRGGSGMTKGELEKRLHETSRRAQSLDSDVQSATEALERTREEYNALSSALEGATTEYVASKATLDTLSNEVSAKEFALIRLRRTADLQNELLKRYEALQDGKIEPVKLSARQSFEIEKKLLRSKEKIESISVVLDGLALKFPHQEEVWDSLNALLLLENGDLCEGQENGNGVVNFWTAMSFCPRRPRGERGRRDRRRPPPSAGRVRSRVITRVIGVLVIGGTRGPRAFSSRPSGSTSCSSVAMTLRSFRGPDGVSRDAATARGAPVSLADYVARALCGLLPLGPAAAEPRRSRYGRRGRRWTMSKHDRC